MKKKKTAIYLGVIASMIALSIVTPLIINAATSYIVERLQKAERETETERSTDFAVDEVAALTVETESETNEESNPPSQEHKNTQQGNGERDRGKDIIVEGGFYDEPVYASQEEEDAANAKAYQDMTERLLSLSEAASTYRKNFNPEYDELKAGLMNAFISGREEIFYEDISNYCFGHYNTSYQIRKVRFDALIEDTDERQTVILEFFTAEDLKNESYVPDLKLCTYNKKNEAFVFFAGAMR